MKPPKARSSPAPAGKEREPVPVSGWDRIEIHMHAEMLGEPQVSFLMSMVKPRNKPSIQPMDFSLDTPITEYNGEVERGIAFNHASHKFVYLNDEKLFSIKNKGAYHV